MKLLDVRLGCGHTAVIDLMEVATAEGYEDDTMSQVPGVMVQMKSGKEHFVTGPLWDEFRAALAECDGGY